MPKPTIPLPPGYEWSDLYDQQPLDTPPVGHVWTAAVIAPGFVPGGPATLIVGRGYYAAEVWCNLAARAWREYRLSTVGIPDGFEPSRVETAGRWTLPPGTPAEVVPGEAVVPQIVEAESGNSS